MKIRVLSDDNQLVVAVFLTLFLLFSVFYFWQRSVTNSGLIDFDDMPSRPAEFVVNINTAPWQEFALLPGIGPVLAKQIIEYRDQNGQFESLENLKEVRGIGEGKLTAMRHYLVCNSN